VDEIVLLSLTASLNPTLVAATTVMLLLDRPVALMLGHLFGAYLTSITLGLVIVFSLSNSSATNTTQNTVSPAVLTMLLVVGFNVVMLWLLELPLVSFAVAPAWTPRAIKRAKLGPRVGRRRSWPALRHGRRRISRRPGGGELDAHLDRSDRSGRSGL
jgi:hypothetical protein